MMRSIRALNGMGLPQTFDGLGSYTTSGSGGGDNTGGGGGDTQPGTIRIHDIQGATQTSPR